MESNKKNKSSEVLRKYLRNRYSEKTEEKIQRWLVESPSTEEKEEASREYWDSLETTKNKETFRALEKVNSKLGFHSKEKAFLYWPFWKVAAIFIFLVGLSGIWFFYLRHNPEMLEVSTLYGETKQVTLPDESVVWLNAGSLLSYPSNFDEKNRLVSLEGEAFFSVTTDKTKPFIVETRNITVKVLGTKFNLRTYSDENHTVATLQEGKIEIKTGDKQNKRLLPNEQLIYNNQTSVMTIDKISPNDIPNWKRGNLLFVDVTLEKIFQTLRRHFNISISIDNTIRQSTEHYTIKFERGEKLELILQILEDVTGEFSYSMENNQVVIKKNSTNIK